ncbi:hypothetical protein DV451_004180 [Geotrichum candidum]|uniref:tRNA(His) guanylyltransferase n=1 Tax=Geotrichum candidum TaxID=1173061 RepID=A0A9P5G3R4_GEOCN|nr:hypothetical protein DV451_004180 [Geotrichum candidum]KAF5106479.1 hypothetical protein DV453_003888 [Geotrichum candidum]
MANSRFEYVRSFERENYLLPDTWIVIRVDGRGFHRFSDRYNFEKPNDLRALTLMNESAKVVMRDITDVILAYGDSDEYSFVLRKQCQLFERRESKLISTFVSTFTAAYNQLWSVHMGPDAPLDVGHMPTFDSRAVVYPSNKILRDYLSWRQADCHINNLYNTTFWALVLKGNQTRTAAALRLKDTFSKDKNEILFSEFGINYNNEPEIFKKGTILLRVTKDVTLKNPQDLSERQLQRKEKKLKKAEIQELHIDLIGDDFWNERPWILNN